MSNKQETIADIVDDIRAQNQGLPEDGYALSPLVCDLLSLADRIEAAAKRERDATREKSSQVGNAAKMRAALEDAEKVLDDSSHSMCGIPPHMNDLLARIRAALSAQPRNCDVGTVEEQAKRFHSFCESNKQCGDVYSCERCQLNSIEDCELAWAQMPYEEGGSNGK